jgi:multiple sugar transport system ATP-binding protein
MGNETFLYLMNGKNIFIARVDPRSHKRVGDDMQVIFDMDKFHVFDVETEVAVR